MKKVLMILGVCFFFYSCATAPLPRMIQDSFPIDKSYDEVWAAIIETFSEMHFPINIMEKDSGLITTEWFSFSGQSNEGWCDCGGLGMNIEVNRQVRFNVFVKKTSENSCNLKVNCLFEQVYYFSLDEGRSLLKRPCVSTGLYEREMFEVVKEKLGIL